MPMNELGINENGVRAAIANADLDKAREYANVILDELVAARRELVQRVTGNPELRNPVTLWATAVEALRKLADHTRAQTHGGQRDAPVLDRAADWLASIGPDTTKLPCEVCLKPTSISCVRCGRNLCAPHAARNTRSASHDGGRLACVW